MFGHRNLVLDQSMIMAALDNAQNRVGSVLALTRGTAENSTPCALRIRLECRLRLAARLRDISVEHATITIEGSALQCQLNCDRGAIHVRFEAVVTFLLNLSGHAA
jgi:hypothetical protein